QRWAGAAERWQRKQVAIAARDAAAREHFVQIGLEEGAGEPLERRPDRARRVGVPRQEALLERAEVPEQVASGEAEGYQIARAVEAIPELVEGRRVATGVESRHEGGRRRPHAREHALELSAEEADAAVRQARGEQADELAVARRGIAKRESDGVELDPDTVVELTIEPLERLPQTLDSR